MSSWAGSGSAPRLECDGAGVLTIPNVATSDGYTAATELGPDPNALQIIYVVANAAVFAQFRPARPDGTLAPYGPEVLITPSTNTVTRVTGVKFRSAVAGVPARVVAVLLEPDDPQFGGGTPFSGVLSSAGGITPAGAGAMNLLYDSVDSAAALGAAAIYSGLSSIAQTATHLRIIAQLVSSIPNNGGTLLQFNADAAAHYSVMQNQSHAASATFTDTLGATAAVLGNTGQFPSSLILDIPCYSDASAHTFQWQMSYFGAISAGNIYQQSGSGYWSQPQGITAVSFINAGAATWQPGTRISVYGITA